MSELLTPLLLHLGVRQNLEATYSYQVRIELDPFRLRLSDGSELPFPEGGSGVLVA